MTLPQRPPTLPIKRLCPGCSFPYLEKVENVGVEGVTMYIHKMEAVSLLGVRATGCEIRKAVTQFFRYAPGILDKPLLVAAPPEVANIMQLVATTDPDEPKPSEGARQAS